jgi:hypothetical protein
MALPKLDEHHEKILRDVERTRRERLATKFATRAFTENSGHNKLDTAPAPAFDWNELDARTRQICEAAIEVALESEREKLVEITRTMTEFVEKTVSAMDRMKGDIDRMFDTLKHATGDGAVSAMQRQRMQAH